MSVLQELVESEWQVADASARSVEHGVRDGRADASDSDLTDALCADLVHVRVVFLHEQNLAVREVGGHRHASIGQVARHRAPTAWVANGVLHQRKANAPHDAAKELAARGLRIQDLASRERRNDAPHANFERVFVYANLHEL